MFEVVRKACEDYEGLQAKKEKKKAKIEELRAKQQLLSHSVRSTATCTRSLDIDILHIVSDDRTGILSQDE